MNSKRLKKVFLIIFLLAVVPFKLTGGTETIDLFKNYILTGQREHICEEGYTLQSLLWKYEYKCGGEAENTHYMRKELLFFNTFGFVFDEQR